MRLKLKELPDSQSGFFKINYRLYLGNEFEHPVLLKLSDCIEKLVLKKYKDESNIFIDIADSDSYIKSKIAKLNNYLDRIRENAEKKQYYELCYNISQVCALLAHALNMYQEIDIA